MTEEITDLVATNDNETALALSADLKALATGNMSDEVFDQIAGSGGYFARLSLQTSTSRLCKQGKIPANHFALITTASKFEDLGKSVDVLVLCARAKAVNMNADEFKVVYDTKSDDFKKLMAESEIKDSGCTYGPEFLVYIPAAKSYALLHCNNASTRRAEVAEALRGLILMGATLGSVYVETTKHEWYTLAVNPCSTISDAPAISDVKENMQKFIDEQKGDEKSETNEGAVETRER